QAARERSQEPAGGRDKPGGHGKDNPGKGKEVARRLRRPLEPGQESRSMSCRMLAAGCRSRQSAPELSTASRAWCCWSLIRCGSAQSFEAMVEQSSPTRGVVAADA